MQPRFQPSRFDEIEDIERYSPGGFHPISIGDTLAQGRYKVLHKLGFGGSSTIWLANDVHHKKLVSLKVLCADISNKPKEEVAELNIPQKLDAILRAAGSPARFHIQVIEDHFMEEGPNGRHQCLTSEFSGPSVLAMSDCPGRISGSRRLRADLARKVAKQVATVLELMHSAGIVHGDISTSNILFRISDHVSKWSDDQVYANFGEPETDQLVTEDGSPLGPHAPTEVVTPIDSARLAHPSILQEDIIVIDFGQSFFAAHPPKDYLPAAPIHYTSPELFYESSICPASDVWALACAIFEIRAGFPLFEPFLGSEVDIKRQMVEMLGRPPEPWWSSFENRQMWFEDNGEPKPMEVQEREGVFLPATKSSIRQRLQEIGQQDEPPEAYEGPMIEKTGMWLGEKEVEVLSDLLGKMLMYRPEDRITMQDVVRHLSRFDIRTDDDTSLVPRADALFERKTIYVC